MLKRGADLRILSRNLFRNSTYPRSISLSSTNLTDNDFIVKSPYASLEYPKVSIDQFIWKDLQNWPNKIALVISINSLNSINE
jgi:hypothetical protein